MQCDMGSKRGGEGDTVILLGSSRKMKDDVRLIFSLIRQQTEMEGREQEVGGWVPHCSPDCQEGREGRAQGATAGEEGSATEFSRSPGTQVHCPVVWKTGKHTTYLFVHTHPSLSQ